MEINITKLEQTEAFGKAIASFLVKSNDFNIIYLDGNLGAGKIIFKDDVVLDKGLSVLKLLDELKNKNQNHNFEDKDAES